MSTDSKNSDSNATGPLPRNIILAGFMGTGKTSVGRELARRLGWQFIDTDDLIVQRAGQSIPQLFEQQGEAGFRKIERDVLIAISDLENHVIATGGGAVVSDENRALLDRAGMLILLTATEETIWQRVRHARHRPLLACDDPRKKIGDLLNSRREAYNRISSQILTDGKTVEEISVEVEAASRRFPT